MAFSQTTFFSLSVSACITTTHAFLALGGVIICGVILLMIGLAVCDHMRQQ